MPLSFRPLDSGGIRKAPVSRHGLTRPHRTHFIGCVVANSEHEIHHWRTRSGKLFPILGAQARGPMIQLLQEVDSEGMDLALRMAAGAEGAKTALAFAVENTFGY